MCGISGLLTKNLNFDKEKLLWDMVDKQNHRGPDDRGIYVQEPEIGLGHNRLSIIDLSNNGHQPMEYLERYVITYNGEIYNYIELKRELAKKGYSFKTDTDTEVIPAAYDCWGKGCLQHFNGMWAFAIWDKKEKKLFCARDRFGVKPFYYHINKERLLFASEIKALLCDETIERVINKPIVFTYLEQGMVDHTDQTFFDGIMKLPAGSLMVVDSDLKNIIVEKYYDVVFSEEIGGEVSDEDIKNFRTYFEDSVKLRLRADVPVGSCLSGGLDSSSVVCCMDDIIKKEDRNTSQHTFSFCAGENGIDESKYIDEVIKNTNAISHKVYIDGHDFFDELEDLIYYQDEPFPTTGMYAGYIVYREAKKNNVTVLLDGQGADEIMCGYRKAKLYYIKKLLHNRKYLTALYEMWHLGYLAKNTRITKNDFYKLKRILFSKKESREKGYMTDSFFENGSGADYSRQADFQYNDLYAVSLPSLLRYVDRNAMAFSIESRLPFLDYRFVEICAALPLSKKIKDGWSKYIMRRSIKMPDMIKKRRDKIGFATPEDEWIKKEQATIKSIFENENFRADKIIDRKRILEDWEDIFAKRNTQALFRCMCLEMWMQKLDVKAA